MEAPSAPFPPIPATHQQSGTPLISWHGINLLWQIRIATPSEKRLLDLSGSSAGA